VTRRTRRLRSAVALPALWLCLAALCPIGAAQAQAPQEIALARETARDGLQAYRAGEYDKALSLFQQARALYPSAQILRMTGYTLLALSKWESAAEAMEASLASSIGPLSEADRKDVQDQLAKAMAHLGVIRATTALADAQLTVDGGEPLPMPLSQPLRLPVGKHTLTLSSPGHPEITREIEIAGGEDIAVALDPPAPPKAEPAPPKKAPAPVRPPPPAPRQPWFAGQRAVGLSLVGAGVGVGVAAVITALIGASTREQVEEDVARHRENFGDACDKSDPRLCRFDRAIINQDADRADTLRDASVWMGIGAGVLGAGGAVLLVAYPWGSPVREAGGRPSVACSLAGVAALSCTGAF
jgi:hypothetical protein